MMDDQAIAGHAETKTREQHNAKSPRVSMGSWLDLDGAPSNGAIAMGSQQLQNSQKLQVERSPFKFHSNTGYTKAVNTAPTRKVFCLLWNASTNSFYQILKSTNGDGTKCVISSSGLITVMVMTLMTFFAALPRSRIRNLRSVLWLVTIRRWFE